MLAPTLRSTVAFPYLDEVLFACRGFPIPACWPSDQPSLVAGKVAWFGATEQVVMASTYAGVVSVLTFDENLVMTPHSVGFPNGPLPGNPSGPPSVTNWTVGLALGRFDPPAVGGVTNPNLQIARLGMTANTAAKTGQVYVELYEVDPATSFVPRLVSTFPVANQQLFPLHDYSVLPGVAITALHRGNPLSAGDLQARSLALGAPEKVTVTGSIQPQVVLGMPPMHVDFVQPANSDPNDPPVVLNVNALPSVYYSQYTTQQTGSNQSSSTNTTSYTLSTKESAGATFSFGNPNIAQISSETKFAATQTHDTSVATRFNTYSSTQFDVSTQTGFSDHVWFTAKRFNIYNYRILGQCVAAAGSAPLEGCPAGTRPLYVQFSGPDQILPGRVDGSLLEWYQPVHEPGNVLSYPWSAALLQDLYAGFAPLTADPATTWATDSSGSTVSVSWTRGSGSDVTSGTVATQSIEVSTSVTGSVTLGLFDGSLTGGYDYNSSSSTSTLNESTSMLGSSTGIRVVKPPFPNPGQYAFAAQTYIFGQQVPGGTLQQIPLGTTVASTGPLWTAFVADPKDRDDGAGVWWPGAYSRPDVALNHPLRWSWTPPNNVHPDEITFNEANPQSPATSDFYVMKGLYVTPASSNGEGSQITQTAPTDAIRLQARVYNYSFADMPQGSKVRVRFYGQPWNHQSVGFAGDPFVIDEVLLNPIPGFDSDSTGGQQPNWSLASTTFTPSAHANSYLVFWVVVWMQEGTAGDGAMVPEMVGHGLVALPGAATPPAAIEIERYSNNVGLYNQPVFVCPSQCGAPPGASVGDGDGPTVDALEIAPKRVQQFEPATVTATLAASSEVGHDGVLAIFYDGDPAQGGEAFDANLVPHIRPGDVYATQVDFRPRTCGPHQIFVVAGTETASAKLKVDCAPDGTEGFFAGGAKRVGSGKGNGALTLFGDVKAPGPLRLRSATATITSLLLDGGKGELVRGPGGSPFLPLALDGRRGRKHGEVVFETPAGAKPRVRLEVEERDPWWWWWKEDRLAFELEVEHASIRKPSGRCGEGKGSAELATGIALADDQNPPLVLNPVLTWRCGGKQLWTWDKLGPAGRAVRPARGGH
jgi:hypothetical protein